jgi:hypothetical protein
VSAARPPGGATFPPVAFRTADDTIEDAPPAAFNAASANGRARASPFDVALFARCQVRFSALPPTS